LITAPAATSPEALALQPEALHQRAKHGREHVLIAGGGVSGIGACERNAYATDDGDPSDTGADEHEGLPRRGALECHPMGQFTTIMARDGHEFQSWLVAPPARPRGALVVLQEIFGVNAHIRRVADDLAAEGYTVIAPSLFDRVRRGIQLDYTPADMQEGRGYVQQLAPEATLRDIAAALAVVKHSGRAGVVGYCWGGSLAYLAAGQLPMACAVVYYGKVTNYLDRRPKCPVMYHYGTEDKSIPPEDVERIRAAYPQAPLYTYAGAGHGFNCEQRESYNPPAAALARERTLEFLARYVAGVEPGAARPGAPGT
jgi:carboxymethylenebutenolidase